MKTSKIEDV